ncbi:hypothetical protein HK407_07g12030 [Ordospora pajunii]|jgi:hypothetical protein|uniref:uncharacterized protein n=1 Tax=Ordospora pajunii TaxID=3039483 RepID=UPI0029526B7C|nr:uncharacterized protein HK407_07g12030 [Ordospora pajunii]KAH9411210.1 hypothetical protein HK407_07g12030 [Ordospora pajunii]
MRNTYAIIVGIIDRNFVLLQKKDGTREVCATNRLHLEEEVIDISGLSAEEIGNAIPGDICVNDTTNDFDRFKQKLTKRIEDEILREKGLA